MGRRAWVSVDAAFLATLLGLPKGCEIIRADFNAANFSLRFGLSGGDALPESEAAVASPEITLNVRLETLDNIERAFASFSHNPKNEWLVFERLRKRVAA